MVSSGNLNNSNHKVCVLRGIDMAYSKILDEIIDELFEELFGTESNPFYGKFIDTDGVYELENGNLIKVINNEVKPCD